MATTVDSRRETASLIGSDKVEGTTVYGGDDQKIGSVQRIMIDKVSGKVAYAKLINTDIYCYAPGCARLVDDRGGRLWRSV